MKLIGSSGVELLIYKVLIELDCEMRASPTQLLLTNATTKSYTLKLQLSSNVLYIWVFTL